MYTLQALVLDSENMEATKNIIFLGSVHSDCTLTVRTEAESVLHLMPLKTLPHLSSVYVGSVSIGPI